MQKYKRYFQEKSMDQQLIDNANKFVETIKDNADLKTKATSLYETIEREFKAFMIKHYHDDDDRESFKDTLYEICQTQLSNPPSTEDPIKDISYSYFVYLYIAAYNFEEKEKPEAKPEAEEQAPENTEAETEEQ